MAIFLRACILLRDRKTNFPAMMAGHYDSIHMSNVPTLFYIQDLVQIVYSVPSVTPFRRFNTFYTISLPRTCYRPISQLP